MLNHTGFSAANGPFNVSSSLDGPCTSSRVRSAILSASLKRASTFAKCASSPSAATYPSRQKFIAIEGEIIKEIFLFRFGLLDKGRETGLERVQLTRMHFEVGM